MLTLRAVKLIHTAAWAFLAGCVIAIPLLALYAEFAWALACIVIILVEITVLALNGLRCPLTDIAARLTPDRRDNFDIYLPLWLARFNKHIFGTIFLAGLMFTLAKWLAR